MDRASLLVFLAASGFVHLTARAEKEHDAGNVRLSVNSNSFQHLATNTAPASRHAEKPAAKLQLKAHGDAVDNSQAQEEQGHAAEVDALLERSFEEADKGVLKVQNAFNKVDLSALDAESRLKSGMRQLSELSDGMGALRESSKDLRASVDKLGIDLQSQDASEQQKHLEKAQHVESGEGKSHGTTEQKREKMMASLLEYAADRRGVQNTVDQLDEELEDISKTLSTPTGKDNEDEQFAKLEQQTNGVLAWFAKLKQLRADRDKMQAKKSAAVSAAEELGIDKDEIIKEMKEQGFDAKTTLEVLDAKEKALQEAMRAAPFS